MDTDAVDADAFYAAHEAAPELDPDRLRIAIDAYLAHFRIHVSRVHAERELTPGEILDAFKPRDVEVDP